MAAPTIYKSTDASAPVLDGTAGSLVNVLTGCLVNGYGAKLAAGWALAFTGTNGADYRPPVGGTRFYLDVNDNGASNGLTGASGQEAAVRAYETMTAYQTGTNAWPTTVQVAALTANWRKSAAASATTRAWIVAADDRTLIMCIADGDTASVYKTYYFGDIFSLKASDAYKALITTRTVVNVTTTTGTLGVALSSAASVVGAGLYMPRVQAATGTSVNVGLMGYGSTWDAATPLTGSPDSNIYLARLVVSDVVAPHFRGYLRGAWQMVTCTTGIADGDTFTGTGDLAGRTFLVVKGVVASSNSAIAIETTAWDTSS